MVLPKDASLAMRGDPFDKYDPSEASRCGGILKIENICYREIRCDVGRLNDFVIVRE